MEGEVAGEPKFSNKNLPHCQFVHKKSHKNRPEVNRTRTAVVESRRITAWDKAQPVT
jgi:hypothetical protein